MIDFYLMTPEHALWEKTIQLAQNCSWRAGPILAQKMQKRDFREQECVCVACSGEEPVGFCTFAEKDELPENNPITPFIGFMFVSEPYRGQRLSEQMIQKVLSYAKALGYQQIYIMSGELGLYEKYGFRKLGEYETIYGTVDQLFVLPLYESDSI